MYFLTTYEYGESRQQALNGVFEFLGLDISSEIGKGTFISNRHGQNGAAMLPKTKTRLQKFYQPYNRMLAELLKNDKYLYGYS